VTIVGDLIGLVVFAFLALAILSIFTTKAPRTPAFARRAAASSSPQLRHDANAQFFTAAIRSTMRPPPMMNRKVAKCPSVDDITGYGFRWRLEQHGATVHPWHDTLHLCRWRSRQTTLGVNGVGDRCRSGFGGVGDSLRTRPALRPAAEHRHTVLTVTTPNKPDGFRGHRGDFGSRRAPNGTRRRPRPRNAAPNGTQ
jgi:hypothetical protein